jgi:hypothetical protein
VFNARGLVCGCVNRTPTEVHAGDTGDVFEKQTRKTHMAQIWIYTEPCKHARAIALGEGQGPTWPLAVRDAPR